MSVCMGQKNILKEILLLLVISLLISKYFSVNTFVKFSPVDTIRCYPQQKSKEYYWPTIRTFPESFLFWIVIAILKLFTIIFMYFLFKKSFSEACTHTYSLEQQMGPKIRACPPVSTDTTVEKLMGSHKAGFI